MVKFVKSDGRGLKYLSKKESHLMSSLHVVIIQLNVLYSSFFCTHLFPRSSAPIYLVFILIEVQQKQITDICLDFILTEVQRYGAHNLLNGFHFN